MCYRYAKTFATGIRKWSKHLTDFPTPKFETIDWLQRWRVILSDICLTDESVRAALIATGPRPFKLHCAKPWGYVSSDPDTSTLHHTAARTHLISDILIDARIRATSDKLTPCTEINTGTLSGIIIRSHHFHLHWNSASHCLYLN